MRVRGACGVGAVKSRVRKEEAYRKLREESKTIRLNHIKRVIEQFKRDLENFALQYRDKICADPLFRHRFHLLCAKIGVDPLVSSKNLWSEMFGFGDYYYELALKISRIALETRNSHGGLISLRGLIKGLRATSRTGNLDSVSEGDVRRAISSLSVLGNNFQVLEIGGKTPFMVSDSIHFNNDQENILLLSQHGGYVSMQVCQNQLGWGIDRFNLVMDKLVKEGLIWIDDHGEKWNFYIPAAQLFS